VLKVLYLNKRNPSNDFSIMNRIDRLVAIMTTLQSKKYATSEFIADKYDISVRTVYRDLKALSEIGVPILFESQRGYSILKDYFLPPVSLTTEEANALILVSSLSERFTDQSTKNHIDNALSKIKSVLRSPDRDKADQFQSQIRIYINQSAQVKSDYLTGIQHAIVNKKILQIKYTNNAAVVSQREIEPIGLTFYSYQWHLIAWCWLRNDYRDFKVNQISELNRTEENFRKKDHYDLNEYIKSLS